MWASHKSLFSMITQKFYRSNLWNSIICSIELYESRYMQMVISNLITLFKRKLFSKISWDRFARKLWLEMEVVSSAKRTECELKWWSKSLTNIKNRIWQRTETWGKPWVKYQIYIHYNLHTSPCSLGRTLAIVWKFTD